VVNAYSLLVTMPPLAGVQPAGALMLAPTTSGIGIVGRF
jgi:hypothetical protein